MTVSDTPIFDSLHAKYNATPIYDQLMGTYSNRREVMTENREPEFDTSLFDQEVDKERERQIELGFDAAHDDALGLRHLIRHAYLCLQHGNRVETGAMIMAIHAWMDRNQSYGMNSMQLDVEDFMRACGQDVLLYPQIPSDEVAQLRINLMIEALLGSTNPVYGSLAVLSKSDELVQSIVNKDIVGIADGLADLLYVVFGTAAAYGINVQTIFDELHRSTMTKVGPDGQVIRQEDGKILKPETFEPADVKKVVDSLTPRLNS